MTHLAAAAAQLFAAYKQAIAVGNTELAGAIRDAQLAVNRAIAATVKREQEATCS